MYELWYKLRRLASDRHFISVVESVVGDDKYDNHTSLQRQKDCRRARILQAFVVGFQWTWRMPFPFESERE